MSLLCGNSSALSTFKLQDATFFDFLDAAKYPFIVKPWKEIFRENLASITKKRGTLAQVAAKTGIQPGLLGRVRDGKRWVTADQLDKLERGLGIPAYKMLMPSQEAEQFTEREESMREIQECVELMLRVPEVKCFMMGQLTAAKTIFYSQIEQSKKKADKSIS